MTPEREFRIHFAKVHLNECRARRHSRVNRDFYWRLFETAQAARRQVAAMRPEPVQGVLL